MKKSLKVGIFLFDEVEVLDFAGPFEVFSISTYHDQSIDTKEEKPFSVKTISETGKLINARNGLKVQPDYSFGNAHEFDILVIPGGYGAREIEVNNQTVIKWIRNKMKEVKIMTSVCTGSFLLAEAGLLEGKKATTHWANLERFQNEFPDVTVLRGVQFVDEKTIVTSAGISAGINMALHIVKRLFGKDMALLTAKRMEYEWKENNE